MQTGNLNQVNIGILDSAHKNFAFFLRLSSVDGGAPLQQVSVAKMKDNSGIRRLNHHSR